MNERVFVKIEDYEDVSEIVDLLRNKVAEAKSTIEHIEALKTQEDQVLDEWKKDITLVESKIDFLNTTLKSP
ncbi:hypothetical protein D6774_01475 [Candidatus Woesearchaeota archaeon]|jgi:hypothetical protein|nr:MAG: hypothetical protein D6774_01475 [Candidatus Woesearchaeota archaeon]